ncbi:MAG: hypothetical protein JKY53_00175 [Flavobacteriales bacterium]|nr:hypothetical protein [Flavobacteriales bacterium]
MTASGNIGDNENETSSADISSAISIGSSASVTILAAQSADDPQWLSIWIYNDGNRTLWVKPQAFGVDNDKKGIPIFSGEKENILEFGKNYRGEWSGIMNSGGSRDVYVTSW